MDRLNRALGELREIDGLSELRSPVHALHPLAKLLATLTYIFITVSFGKYRLSALLIMALYPVLMFQISGISIAGCFYRLRIVLPLVLAVGLFNPLLDRTVIMHIGPVAVSGGFISMLTLMLKGTLCLMASYILVATTAMDALCAALRRLHIPSLAVTLLLLTYRYISVMTDEISVMNDAYRLRAPGQRGIHISAWGSFLGQLLLRSIDRAQELYSSMLLRGFHGEFFYAAPPAARINDYVFALLCVSLFALCRAVNVTQLIGGLFV